MLKKLTTSLLLALCCSGAYAAPFAHQAMDTIKIPYTEVCLPDPEVVQEYLLEMEIDYYKWLAAQNNAVLSDANTQDVVLTFKKLRDEANAALDQAVARLGKLREKCASEK